MQTHSLELDGTSGRDGHRAKHNPETSDATRTRVFPLTDIQQAYWVGRSGQFALGQVSAHGYMEIEIEPDTFVLERLEFAFNQVVRRHDMLRAIVGDDGLQRILPEVPAYRFARLELSSATSEQVQRALAGVRQEMSHQVLDAARWPLFEFRASLLPRGRMRLHLSIDVLIFDAHSLDLISRDWAEYYRDPAGASLAPLSFSYADCVERLQQLERSAEVEASARYWRSKIEDFPDAPELPLETSPAELETVRFTRRSTSLPCPEWERLKAAAARANLTPSVVLLAAYATVIARWSAKSRFALNLTMFNRIPFHPDVDKIVGDFTSVLPLAIDASTGATFVDLARTLQEGLWSDMDHRSYSGIRFVRDLGERRRDASVALPIVFTSTLKNDRSGASEAAMGWIGKRGYTITQTPQVWLDCQVAEEDGELVVDWDAVDALFPNGVLDDMFSSFSRLVGALARGELEGEVQDLLPAEQRAVYARANATSAPIQRGLLHTPVLAQCERTPERIAVADKEQAWTYAELRQHSNRLAHHLWALGVEAGERVGILLPKGFRQVVAAVGILEAGAVYVPLAPEQPRDRSNEQVSICQIRKVVTVGGMGAELAGVELVALDALERQEHEVRVLPELVEPSDLAYVIFTSGTTGRPKGVAISHRGALNTVVDVNRRYAVTADDRVLALSALTFDLSVYDIFGLLSVGGALVVPDENALKDPAQWQELMTTHGVTLWNTVPALMDIYATYLNQVLHTRDERLRIVMLSGDWIPTALPGLLRRVLPNAELHSLGGATEASIWSIAYPIASLAPEHKRVPYGKPLQNQTFHVLNERFESCPFFVKGELFIGGVGLATSYYNDVEQTKGSFITHPRTGERLYKTGDLGRYLPDGNIDFLGRKDFQAKVNGYRVELEEIEHAASRCPGVQAAVVTLQGDREKAKRLVGYFVVEPGGSCAADTIRAFLSEKLPSYMVPALWVQLAALPLSANGKMDRKALPNPEQPAREASSASKGEVDALTAQIMAAWAKALGLDSVSPDDGLADLGGTSVHMIKIHAELKNRLPRPVSLVDMFFTYPTIAALVAHLEAPGGASKDAKVAPEPNTRVTKLAEQRRRRRA